MNTEERSARNTLDLALAVLSRRKWLALIVLLLTLAGGVGVVAALPEIYKSTATVLIERQQIPDEFVQSTVTSTLETRLQTISQDILSRSRLEELINRDLSSWRR